MVPIIETQIKTIDQPKKRVKKRIVVPALPKREEIIDPSIDARYQALMREQQRLDKMKTSSGKKKDPLKGKKKDPLKMSIKEINDKVEQYMIKGPNKTLMKKYTDFMNRFDGKKPGSKLKIDKFTIVKEDDYSYDMYYELLEPSGKIETIKYISGPKANIAKKLYEFADGILIWHEGMPMSISEIARKSLGGDGDVGIFNLTQ